MSQVDPTETVHTIVGEYAEDHWRPKPTLEQTSDSSMNSGRLREDLELAVTDPPMGVSEKQAASLRD